MVEGLLLAAVLEHAVDDLVRSGRIHQLVRQTDCVPRSPEPTVHELEPEGTRVEERPANVRVTDGRAIDLTVDKLAVERPCPASVREQRSIDAGLVPPFYVDRGRVGLNSKT